MVCYREKTFGKRHSDKNTISPRAPHEPEPRDRSPPGARDQVVLAHPSPSCRDEPWDGVDGATGRALFSKILQLHLRGQSLRSLHPGS